MLIPFLERHFGEATPVYLVHSINLWGCLLLPPVVGAMTGHRETFSIILPGMWLMAVSPLWLVVLPNIGGSIGWLVTLTLGDVAWSPRHSAWAASMAPTGREGVFVAVASIKSLLISWPSQLFNGYVNERWNPNCKGCRDSAGHFCDTLSPVLNSTGNGSTVDVWQCLSSADETCPDLSSHSGDFATELNQCATTCHDCPGWTSNSSALWGLVLLSSLISPLLVWLMLPCLRDASPSKSSVLAATSVAEVSCSCRQCAHSVCACHNGWLQRCAGMCGREVVGVGTSRGYAVVACSDA